MSDHRGGAEELIDDLEPPTFLPPPHQPEPLLELGEVVVRALLLSKSVRRELTAITVLPQQRNTFAQQRKPRRFLGRFRASHSNYVAHAANREVITNTFEQVRTPAHGI